MPQPLKVETTKSAFIFGPNLILQRQELAAAIGNVCANWSLVENYMVFLYSLVMGDYLPKKEGFAPPTHPVAMQVLDTLNSFNPKLDLLTSLLEWTIEPNLHSHFKNVTVKDLKKRYKERSIIAHGLWELSPEYPDALILTSTFGSRMVYKLKCFEDISARILKEHKLLGELIHTLYQQRNTKNKMPLAE